MKSKYFSNDFDNKMYDFLCNTGQAPKPLSALVFMVPRVSPVVIN